MNYIGHLSAQYEVDINSDSKRFVFNVLSRANEIAHKNWILNHDQCSNEHCLSIKYLLEQALTIMENTNTRMTDVQSIQVKQALEESLSLINAEYKDFIATYSIAYASITYNEFGVPF